MTTQELKLNKLKELIQLADSGLTREEFTSNFKIIIDLIKSLKLANQQEREGLLIMMKSFEAKMSSDQTDEMVKMKDQAMNYCEKEMNTMLREHEAMISAMDAKMDEIKPLEPIDTDLIAKQASDLAITAIKPLIPEPYDLSKELLKAGDLIATSLENLDDDKKLEISAIKDLQEILDELKQSRTRTFGGGGFSLSAMTQHFINDEIPVDSGDHLTFTINYTPVNGTFKLYRSRARQNLTEDYTLSGKSLTLTVAFDSISESLFCDYIK